MMMMVGSGSCGDDEDVGHSDDNNKEDFPVDGEGS